MPATPGVNYRRARRLKNYIDDHTSYASFRTPSKRQCRQKLLPDTTINWTELREFRAVDLVQSFVLSWDVDADSLRIDLDLSLLPDHAFYEEPRPKETACFRPAILEFPQFTEAVDAIDGGEIDAVTRLPHGQISGLQLIADGEYELSGEFGAVRVFAERPILRLKGPVT